MTRDNTRSREKRWVVRAGDGSTVAEIVRRAGEPVSAVEEGRVFVGRVRVKTAETAVRVGDDVRIGAGAGTRPAEKRAGTGTGERSVVDWGVIWERDGLLACWKPAGIPTVADHGGAAHALVALAARSVGRKEKELLVTSRLDREVSGVVVFALNVEAEGRLRTAREQGRYSRRYVAIAARARDARDGQSHMWDAPIGAGKDPRHRAVLGSDAKAAQTRWSAVAQAGAFTMLAVEPQTGRTHQIRVHASHARAPLLGDRDYGGPTRITLDDGRVVALARIALHAARVSVPDAKGEPLVAEAPFPRELVRVWAELGGVAEAWDRAASCELEPSP